MVLKVICDRNEYTAKKIDIRDNHSVPQTLLLGISLLFIFWEEADNG